MELTNEESAIDHELLQAQAHVWNHTFQFINPMALKCAIELEIPDKIHSHGGSMSLSDLIASLQIPSTKSQYLYHLMRILTHSGFFITSNHQHPQDVKYQLNTASRLLLKNSNLSMRNYLLLVHNPVLKNPWNQLSNWFQAEKHNTPFENFHGISFWECASNDSELQRMFQESLASDSLLISHIVVNKCRWVFEGVKTVVDVGGGNGITSKAIADAFPELICTVFDLQHVVSGLQGTENLRFLGGNMFDFIPPADIVLLKWILHNWSDQDCKKILENCKQAITSDCERSSEATSKQKLIIIDIVMDYQNLDYKTIETQLFFDTEMMALVFGKERTEKEWAKLFMDAGFSSYKVYHVFGVKSLIEVYL